MTEQQRPPRRPTAPDGFVVVDKPAGWTSHDVVGRVRRLAGTRKVGHAGTLDPMATGVLVVGIGRATRLLTYVVGADKAYDATIRLGVGTTTDDAEGEVRAAPGFVGTADDDALRAAVADLTGDIRQVPTTVSAIKVGGKRAYALARAGEEVELKARPVTVGEFTVHGSRPAVAEGSSVPVLDLDVTVVVSSGTYVRALARDLGAALGTAGHLTALRRTRVGGHTLDQARTLEAMEAQADAEGVLATIPMAQAAAADLPVRELTDDEARDLGFGRWVAPSDRPGTVAAVGPDGALIALLEDTRRQGQPLAKPVLVLAPAS
ncbi:tRNA pseudouridine(55) synthase TruB [Xylanimonas sp. McL0601]|uniref:tRNA pseudouridine(55) synthase TruB n=1 Tax=Xylanimonas sp. McL0601 TaxID=3414739 RepID=UPI003CF364A5